MQCEMCKRRIEEKDGYYTTFHNAWRKDYHIKCCPVFVKTHPKDESQLQLFKEKRNEKLP